MSLAMTSHSASLGTGYVKNYFASPLTIIATVFDSVVLPFFHTHF